MKILDRCLTFTEQKNISSNFLDPLKLINYDSKNNGSEELKSLIAAIFVHNLLKDDFSYDWKKIIRSV